MGAVALLLGACGDDGDVDAAEAAPSGEAATTTTAPTDAPTTTTAPADDGLAVAFQAVGAPQAAILTTNCNPDDPADCILPTNFPPMTITGDLVGTAFGTAAVIGRNGVYPGADLSVFVGELAGCGTGSLVLTSVGTYDPSTGITTGQWTINADGGTGQLADVRGGGTSITDADGGTYEGTLQCR